MNSQGTLTRKDLLSMAIGQIIGVGIMTMTGIAIGFTGRSVNIAYILAGIVTIINAIPQIFIGGTARFPGGQYTQIAVLTKSKLIAGIYTFVNLSMLFAISFYTLSFCDYFLSLFPGVNSKLISLVLLTLLFSLHLFGVKQAARLQNTMCIVLAVAIALYIVLGIPHVQADYFSNGFMTGGVGGFLLATIYLTFAAGGATYVVNYSSESKNPTKDIPWAIVVATLLVVIVYALMSTVAAGVLPVEEVANMPLSVSAKTFMSSTVYTFFVVGGAMFALLTTLNFSIGMMLYPAEKACEDGWLPKFLAKKNKKFGTPHWMLLFFYLFGIVPILLNIDLSTVANSTVIIAFVTKITINYAALKLPKALPDQWSSSKFHVSNVVLKAVCIFSIIIMVLSIVLLFVSTSKTQIILNFVILGVSVLLALIRRKNVNVTMSIE